MLSEELCGKCWVEIKAGIYFSSAGEKILLGLSTQQSHLPIHAEAFKALWNQCNFLLTLHVMKYLAYQATWQTEHL